MGHKRGDITTVAVIGTRGMPGLQGGVERHCEKLYPLMAAEGKFRFRVYRRRPYLDEAARAAKYDGIEFVDLPSTRVKGLEALLHTFLAACHIAFHRPDVVHVHNMGPAYVAPLLRLLGLRVVMTYHSVNYEHPKWGAVTRWLLRLSERVALRCCNRVIFVNRFRLERMSDRVKRKSVYIPNGVEPARRVEDTTFLERHGITPGGYILAVGRLSPEKGFDTLLARECRDATRCVSPNVGTQHVASVDCRDVTCHVRDRAASSTRALEHSIARDSSENSEPSEKADATCCVPTGHRDAVQMCETHCGAKRHCVCCVPTGPGAPLQIVIAGGSDNDDTYARHLHALASHVVGANEQVGTQHVASVDCRDVASHVGGANEQVGTQHVASVDCRDVASHVGGAGDVGTQHVASVDCRDVTCHVRDRAAGDVGTHYNACRRHCEPEAHDFDNPQSQLGAEDASNDRSRRMRTATGLWAASGSEAVDDGLPRTASPAAPCTGLYVSCEPPARTAEISEISEKADATCCVPTGHRGAVQMCETHCGAKRHCVCCVPTGHRGAVQMCETHCGAKRHCVCCVPTEVVFTGYTAGDDLRALYSHARLMVIPSLSEGFPLVMLEAMSYGLPIVASDIEACHLVELGDDHYFTPGDAPSLARAIARVLAQDEPPRYDLSAFSWQQIAAATATTLL